MDPSDLKPRLRVTLRSLSLWALLAFMAWVMLALLMAMLHQAQQNESGFSWSALANGIRDPAFQAPMRELAWNTVDTLFWPVIAVAVVVLLRRGSGEFLIRRRFGRKDEAAAMAQSRLMTLVLQSLRIIPMAVAGIAAVWAVMAVYAFADGRDHWEALPWVTPPYLSEFLARHPMLNVERLAGGKLTLRDGRGNSIRLAGGEELTGAEAHFEPCPRELGAEQLGGIPPYPGMPCATLVHLRNTDGEQVLYVFNARDSDPRAIYAHFARWADAHGGSRASSTGESHLYLSASSRDDAWRLEVDSRQGRATCVVIRYRTEPTR